MFLKDFPSFSGEIISDCFAPQEKVTSALVGVEQTGAWEKVRQDYRGSLGLFPTAWNILERELG